jgi:SAM-dependent methyltransferase
LNPRAYKELADTEAAHWWFVGRRAVIASALRRLPIPKRARILEVGCGTGGNLSLLRQFGEVSAMDASPDAVEKAASISGGHCRIEIGECPDRVPFADERFDLICLFDVLEHVEADVKTLAILSTRLSSHGSMVVTVPAYRWLWSAHDEFLHHKRRYTLAELRAKASAAGLVPIRLTYFNTFLFPLVAVSRAWSRVMRRDAMGTAIPPRPVNAALLRIFAAEHMLLKRIAMPYGVSILGIFTRSRGQVAR